jgi:hypothetical protein
LISLLILERLITLLPYNLRKAIMHAFLFKLLRRIRLAAWKGLMTILKFEISKSNQIQKQVIDIRSIKNA